MGKYFRQQDCYTSQHTHTHTHTNVDIFLTALEKINIMEIKKEERLRRSPKDECFV